MLSLGHRFVATKVDNKPIISKVKPNPNLKVQAVNFDAINEDCEHTSKYAPTSSTDDCHLFYKVPSNEGIMIMMHEPQLKSNSGSTEAETDCTCLKIVPQLDSNLVEMHPNIYIPSPIMDHPDDIVKYGGGGSGVTVFGGYHPQLGSLVMKHGGHKDLLELVSLYKIERELHTRGYTKMNTIKKSYSSVEGDDKHIKNVKTPSKLKLALNKVTSQPVIGRFGALLGKRKGGSAPDLAGVMGNLPLSLSAEGLSLMHTQQPKFEDKNEYQDRIQSIENAMREMKERIPAFRMVYISPLHLRERQIELMTRSYTGVMGFNMSYTGHDSYGASISSGDSSLNSRVSIAKKGRPLWLFGSSNVGRSSLMTHKNRVDLCFGGSHRLYEVESHSNHICASKDGSDNDGYRSLLSFVNQLYHSMKQNNWKVTLAQQTIGRDPDDPTKSLPTASQILTKGKLRGRVLHKLIDEEIQVIRNLKLLTLPNEVDILDGLRLEYESIKARMMNAKMDKDRPTAADVSDTANSFTGNAIVKNFHPETGRFVILRQFALDLKHGKIHLQSKEVMPANHLEKLLNDCFERQNTPVKEKHFRKSSLEDTFELLDLDDDDVAPDEDDPQSGNPLYLIHGLNQWQSLLETALNMKNPNATCRIWTCGVSDGGLHNMFLGADQIWLFDLGEPKLETIPGFLTKFLMSFFHALGMEEDVNGDWVVRFVQSSEKLRLTDATKELLADVHQAFNITIDRLIRELFDGDEEVRLLLLRYVMTQLISDASFCIEKWRIKGGGDELRSDHQYCLEKWLWRSLWDLYACEEIRRRYMSRKYMLRRSEFREESHGYRGLKKILEDIKED